MAGTMTRAEQSLARYRRHMATRRAVQVILPDELFERLTRQAAAEDRSRPAVLREALRVYLRLHGVENDEKAA